MFKEIFIRLCNERGVAPTTVCNEIGLSNATFSCWTDTSVPRKATLYKLADYFGVSVEYLKGEETTPPAEVSGLDVLPNGRTYMAPLYETVSAGFGALARDEVVDYIPVCLDKPSDANRTLCIRVRGDSMRPMIEDGDIVQVRKQDTVDSGSVAVVLIDGGEGYVKRVEYGNGWIELRSFNPIYRPIRIVGKEAESVRVVGSVVKVIKDVAASTSKYDTTWDVDALSAALLEETAGMDPEDLDFLMEQIRLLKRRRKFSGTLDV